MRKTTVRHPQEIANEILAFMLCCGALLGGAGSVFAADVRDHRAEEPFVGPPGFTFCGKQGEHCRFSGTVDVAYGGPSLINGKVSGGGVYAYKYGIATGGINCKDDNFPNPPDDHHQKACYVRDVRDHRPPGSQGSANWAGSTKCAEHGQRCQFRGIANVYYGPPGGNGSCYKYGVTDGIDCDSRGFPDCLQYRIQYGFDQGPEDNYVCYMKLQLEKPTAAPTPTPKPAPTNTPVWKARDHR